MNIIPNHLKACRLEEMAQTLPRTCADDHNDRYSAGKGEIEMSTFTPGPWEFDDDFDADDDCRYRVVEPKSGLHFVLATTYISGADDIANGGSAEANARLMADAPAMLDALEKAVDHIERNKCQHEDTYRGGAIWEICRECGAKWADDDGGKPEFKWPEYVEQARALIAKHRGGK